MKRFLSMGVLWSILTTGCGAPPPDSEEASESSLPAFLPTGLPILPALERSPSVIPPQQLLFTAIAPLAWPWQAQVFALNLENDTWDLLLSGESSDPLLLSPAWGEFFLVNRSQDQKNLRRLLWQSRRWDISPQMKFLGGDLGDPHGVVRLEAGVSVWAHYNQGILRVWHETTGTSEVLDLPWDLPDGIPFKPEALLWAPSRKELYVVHHGLSVQQGKMVANGSQQLFILEYHQGKLHPVSVGIPSRPGRIRGIPFHGSFPVALIQEPFQELSEYVFIGLCSRYLASTSRGSASPCQAGVESFQPQTRTVHTLWKLDPEQWYMNGVTLPASTPYQGYAAVEDSKTGERSLILWDASVHSAHTVYTYGKDSGGFWGSFYDPHRETLWVGDVAPGGKGRFEVLQKDGTWLRTIPLPKVPYNGVFVWGGL